MDETLSSVLAYGWLIAVVFVVLALAFGYKLLIRLAGGVIVPEDSVALVNKKWVLFGQNRNLPDGAIIALNGEAGWQADTLPPGLHWGYWPWQYEVTLEEFVNVPQGFIGVVESRDGKPLTGGRVLCKQVDCDSFQSARKFLVSGGERGPQITIIPPGTYRINTALFTVNTKNEVTEIGDSEVGIVTTKDGKALPTGEIAGKEVPGHNMFQDAEAFITSGGYKGRQEQVVLAGRYFINPFFATVERVPLTQVPIAHVGVVIAYVGDEGQDVTGDSFKHGNLVKKGEKGVWVEPLDPGKYPVNPFTHKVELVPTANVVLNWATGKTESHKLDEKLSTITVRSSDGFKFNLDVSQIIHVPRNEAPKVIARFGSMANLVTQVLEPTIGNYFRNTAQKSDVIDFLTSRSIRQSEAKASISEALAEYNVNAVDTLIGDINPPEELMKTLTDRKIAEQEKKTYSTQQEAEDVRKNLEQARAMAETQHEVVGAQRTVEIEEFKAQAIVKKAKGESESKTINAEADARVTELNGNAEAGKVKAIGTAEADVIKLKVASMEAGNFASVKIAEALSGSGQKLVPEIIAGGSGNGADGIVSVLLAGMVRDSMNGNGKNGHGLKPPTAPSVEQSS